MALFDVSALEGVSHAQRAFGQRLSKSERRAHTGGGAEQKQSQQDRDAMWNAHYDCGILAESSDAWKRQSPRTAHRRFRRLVARERADPGDWVAG